MWSKLELGYHHNPTWLSFPWEAPIIFSYLIQEIILYGERIEPDNKASEKMLSLSHWTPEAVCHILRLPNIDGVHSAMQALEKSGKVRVCGGVGIPGLAKYQADPTAGERQERYKALHNTTNPLSNGDQPFKTASNGRLERSEREDQREKKERTPLTPRKRRGIVYTPDFEAFWEAYPWKDGKGRAAKAWEKNDPPRPVIDTILSSLEALKRGRDWMKEGGKYIPLPATWINAGGWDSVPRAPIQSELSQIAETPSQRAWREQREQAWRWHEEAKERENQNGNGINSNADHHHLLGGVREIQDDGPPTEHLDDDDGRHTG